MKTLAEIASTGDRLKTLQALRDRLATDLDLTTSARDVASLTSRLVEVLEQIADLTTEEDHDDLGDLLLLPGGATG